MFCGKGGWSVPFIEDGDEVYGIDIKDWGYPKGGQLILQDVRTIDGSRFKGLDLIMGSPPCTEFSQAKAVWKNRGSPPNIEKGLELVKQFERVVSEASPRYWFFENVSRLELFYHKKHNVIWRFKISRNGKRSLWGNFPIPLSPHFVNHRSMERDPAKLKVPFYEWGAWRAKIPYPIARFVCDVVKGKI